MILNQAGQLVLDVWNRLPERFSRVNLEAFIIMPNHVHGILFFPGSMAKSNNSRPNADERDSKANPHSQSQCSFQNNVVSGLALPQGKACPDNGVFYASLRRRRLCNPILSIPKAIHPTTGKNLIK
ncbi:hypothetical protein [Desulfatibacillum aliphaticivorans]|uniref:hypothetical protein n=1 Tax=Desulfatibacillum aliphaticivorans TaxID=218208 RepID=UPI00042123DD|nr:hypothetical protein [Desulfatibacillum aliphaticivorans]